MIKLNIKPLSVNQAFKGRKFKTDKYAAFEIATLLMLPSKIEIPDTKMSVTYEFGFSSAASDIDNAIKPFQDILQKKYGFDDKQIHQMHVTKKKVQKGQEYIKFKIEPFK